MKMKARKFVSMSLSLVMIFVCAVPVFATATDGQAGYAVNGNGETYGNYLEALEIGYEADLILAEGENGVLGYVRASDLDDTVESPDEVQSSNGDRYIPLYSEDGVTVIGSYFVGDAASNIPQTYGAYTYGNIGSMNLPSYTANSQSGIKGSVGGVTAITTVQTSALVARSWIGIQARVYKQSSGALVGNSSWVYNNEACEEFSKSLYHVSLLNEAYYSAGYVKLWNSEISDYWTYSTFNSPVVLPST